MRWECVVVDNLRKGAALNTVQIAELLIDKIKIKMKILKVDILKIITSMKKFIIVFLEQSRKEMYLFIWQQQGVVLRLITHSNFVIT